VSLNGVTPSREHDRYNPTNCNTRLEDLDMGSDIGTRFSIGQFDPPALAGLADPYTPLQTLREQCPISHSDSYGGFWNLFTYKDVCTAAVDAVAFSSRDVTIPSKPLLIASPPIMIDPPTHMDFRHPLLKKFTPKAVADLEAPIRVKVGEMIDQFIGRGCADLADELFIPFPAFAALKLLGLPSEDFPKFSRWARLAFSTPEEGSPDAAWPLEAAAYFAPLYESLADSHADDIPSIARRLVIDGREIEVTEFIALLITLVTAGLDTTTSTSANIILLLDEQPHLRRELIEHPELLPTAIEEFLRYLTPLPMLARTTTDDVTVTGVTIPEGEKVALHWLSANHDPAEFPDPETVVLDRSPNRHVAFGIGPHRCIGMHLARLQIRVMLNELLRRAPDYEVVRDQVVRGPGVSRLVHALPVRFSAQRHAAGSAEY
jgi:cytochrome P450